MVISRIALPREIRVGGGALSQLSDLLATLGLARPLIVTDKYLVVSGAVQGSVFAETVADPTDACAESAAAALRQGKFDCVIGFGGGSPIDTAKAAGILATKGGPMRRYRAPTITDAQSLPVIAIPTTAGSGSECTRFTIITDSETNEKMLCAGLAFLPLATIVDYELTLSMPPRLTADTGIDALTHAIEAFISVRSNPFSDGMALAAMRTIFANLRDVYRDPGNRRAREAMTIAATQAGIAFSNSSVALVHGMSRPIGAHFRVAHGLSNAMLLPTITEFSIDSSPARYAQCARTMGLADDRDADAVANGRLVTALRDLNADLEVPTPRSYGLDESEWVRLTPLMAQQALDSGSPGNSPRVPTAADIEGLYRAIWV